MQVFDSTRQSVFVAVFAAVSLFALSAEPIAKAAPVTLAPYPPPGGVNATPSGSPIDPGG